MADWGDLHLIWNWTKMQLQSVPLQHPTHIAVDYFLHRKSNTTMSVVGHITTVVVLLFEYCLLVPM